MSYFGIEGYRPQWRCGRRAITAAHGGRLHALIGRRLEHIWLVWDRDDDEWFADGPVVLDFGGEHVEISHQKFADLSITWNTIDPVGRPNWSSGSDDDPDVHTFDLSWRDDAMPEPAALHGSQLTAVELLEWAGRDVANGMIAVGFVFGDQRMTISNALDANMLEFGAPPANYRSHPLGAPGGRRGRGYASEIRSR